MSRKVIDCAINAGMQQELTNVLKSFIYDAQNKITKQNTENHHLIDINNSVVIRHKGRPPKRFKSNVEQKESRVLNDSTNVKENGTSASENDNIKGRRCRKCKQYGHYSKTCQN